MECLHSARILGPVEQARLLLPQAACALPNEAGGQPVHVELLRRLVISAVLHEVAVPSVPVLWGDGNLGFRGDVWSDVRYRWD